MTSVPPCSVVASPIEETVTSTLSPECANAPRFAVTMTAATLRVRTSFETAVRPKVCRMLTIVFEVKSTLVVSPVPPRPVTMP
jgi:hypothetical protein